MEVKRFHFSAERAVTGQRSGESKPERTGTPFRGPQKIKGAFQGPKMSEFLPERLIKVRPGPRNSKHCPTVFVCVTHYSINMYLLYR